MKRLLILSVVALLTASASGCCSWFNKGASCNTCPTGSAGYGDPYMSAPSVTSGTDPYLVPGPG